MDSAIYVDEDLKMNFNLWDLRAVDLIVDEEKGAGIRYFATRGDSKELFGDGYQGLFNAAVASGLYVQNLMGQEAINAALLSSFSKRSDGRYDLCFIQGGSLSGDIDDFSRFSREVNQVRANIGAVMPLPRNKIY